jgi:argininosuccinate lyase
MAAAADDGRSVATDLAEQLVREGVPFREAHVRVAERVAAGERFDQPTAAEAAAGRQSPEQLAQQLGRARRAVAEL